jgi:outer membrane receptor protein involved in Fe transport
MILSTHSATEKQLTGMIRLVAAILLCFVVSGFGQTRLRFTGVVVDANGAVVSNASVRVVGSGAKSSELENVTDAAGQFVLETNADEAGVLIVQAPGFQTFRTTLSASETEIRVVLSPLPVSETVTITRSETHVEESAASVALVRREDLDASAATTLDDKLRQVPGFSLFRRAGSRTANPTTQGVSLRGVGASGASRALVIADGVPLNDPFGGWIYWGRVPAESIAQVEILRGTSGDLYGSSAIGGAISVITRRPESEPFASIEASYGNEQTPFASVYSSIARSDWSGSLAGELFETDGFIPVDQAQRGSVDTRANVRRWGIVPFLQRSFNKSDRGFLSVEFFHEERENGTRLQTNDTDLKVFSGGVDWQPAVGHVVAVRANGGIQRYDQTFSAVSADRNSESLNRFQHVPSSFLGLSGQWTGNYRKNIIFAGAELRRVDGHSDETGFVAGNQTSKNDAGGREFTGSVFAGMIVPIRSRLTVSGGFRLDSWRNLRGFTRSTVISSGATTLMEFPDRSESAFSPRLSASYRFTNWLSVAANVAGGFRRPTLNELYRNFRVGDVLTLANANLRAERARGFDAAAIVNGFEGRLYIRAGMFCTTISDNVSNVTLNVTPSLITRQRQNAARTRSCGIEADGNFQVSDNVRIAAGYLFVDSRVSSFPTNPSLEGLLIPQVARHQVTFQSTYSGWKETTLGVQLRAVGPQFDDDHNQFRLRAFSSVDVFASRRFGQKIEIFAAAENLFDTKIEAGRTPVLTLASPRTFRAGLRLRLGRN